MTRPYLFFPFSHISKDQLETLLAFLPCFYFFPVALDLKDSEYLKNYVDRGRIIPLFSEKEHVTGLDQTFKNYKAWADIHRGSQGQLKSLISENPYFTSDSDVSAIKSRIKRNSTGEYSQASNQDILQKDFLFLKIAGQYDAEQENINLEFSNIGKAKEDMISSLLGSDSYVNDKKSAKTNYVYDPDAYDPNTYDPGELMPRERLKFFLKCISGLPFIRENEEKLIWVTTSEALISYLEIICTDSINTLDINPIKVHEKNCEYKAEWQQQLSELITLAAEHDTELKNVLSGKGPRKDPGKDLGEKLTAAGDGCSLSGRIRVTHFFGESINTMFNLKDKHLTVCLIRLT